MEYNKKYIIYLKTENLFFFMKIRKLYKDDLKKSTSPFLQIPPWLKSLYNVRCSNLLKNTSKEKQPRTPLTPMGLVSYSKGVEILVKKEKRVLKLTLHGLS